MNSLKNVLMACVVVFGVLVLFYGMFEFGAWFSNNREAQPIQYSTVGTYARMDGVQAEAARKALADRHLTEGEYHEVIMADSRDDAPQKEAEYRRDMDAIKAGKLNP